MQQYGNKNNYLLLSTKNFVEDLKKQNWGKVLQKILSMNMKLSFEADQLLADIWIGISSIFKQYHTLLRYSHEKWKCLNNTINMLLICNSLDQKEGGLGYKCVALPF